MSGQPAFRNDPALKAAAIADAQAETHPGWSIMATEDERASLAQAYGLTPGILSLLISPQSQRPRAETITEGLELIAPGSDLDAMVLSWILSVWAHPVYGPAHKLAGTSAMPAAEAVIALLKASFSGETVSRQQWRAARSAVIAASDVPANLAGYVTLVAAMAWDPSAAPGLPGDIWAAWDKAFQAELGVAAGFPEAEQDKIVEAVRASHQLIRQREGNSAGDVAPEQLAAHLDACLAEMGYADQWKGLSRYFTEVLGPAYEQRQPAAMRSVAEALLGSTPERAA